MKRAALLLLLLIALFTVALLGLVAGAFIAFEPPKPAAKRAPLMVHPLACDARVIVSAAGHVYSDRCWVRKSPQVWL